MSQQLNLLSMFQTVSGALSENQASLNKADSHNGDHGDNMVQIFNLVTQAVGDKSKASPADQLLNAGELLMKQKSGSAQVYSKGLLEAADTFQDKSITTDTVMTLVQTLLGGGNAAQTSQDSPIAGMLGGLLGGDAEGDAGLDAGDLLSAGLAFLSAKNRGDSTTEALIEAVISASPLGEVSHRAQSSQVVVSTILENLGSFVN
ncbi:MAG: hypothetical protein ABFS17_03305 [Chloroflexota bacterium]